MNPSPGWYPDPVDPAFLRRWDGGSWTEDTAPVETGEELAPPQATAEPVDLPAPAEVVAPAFAASPGAPEPPEPAPVALPVAPVPPSPAPPAPGLPVFGASTGPPPAGSVPGPPRATAPPAPPSPSPLVSGDATPASTWGTPVSAVPGPASPGPVASGQPTAASSGALPPGAVPMTTYRPEGSVSVSARGATGNAAVAAVLLGLQSALPIMGALGLLLAGVLLSDLEREFGSFGDEFGGVGSGMSTGGLVLRALVLLVYAAALIGGGVGMATAKPRGRQVVIGVQALTLVYLSYLMISTGEVVGVVLVALLPLVNLALAITDT